MPKTVKLSAQRIAVSLMLATAFARGASAQDRGSVSGAVTDSAHAPIFRAQLAVEGSDIRAFTDENGTFTLENVVLGPAILTVRRLGFSPARIPVQVSQSGGATVAIHLTRLPTVLPPVVVRPPRLEYSGRLAGYYKRLEKGSSGYFITREEIDRENPTTLGQLLQHVPGVRVARGAAGITGMRMRGRACWPLVWLDGTPMPAGETDIDSFVPSSIQGIELYLGSTTAPLRYIYDGDVSSCGTVLLWSRGPDTDPIGGHPPPVDLEEMLDRHAVYSADRVDSPAQLDSAHSPQPDFPQALFAARVRGMVMAEFVVDTLGRVESPTVGIVSSTGGLFSEAVRTALRNATYVPAMKAGHRVRQLVQQLFRFDVAGEPEGIGQAERPDAQGPIKN